MKCATLLIIKKNKNRLILEKDKINTKNVNKKIFQGYRSQTQVVFEARIHLITVKFKEHISSRFESSI